MDPDHLPAALSGIQAMAQKFPNIPQIACFDTAFHHTLPDVAKMYALPRRFYDSGIRRYGFHGLSYEYIVGELQSLDAGSAAKVIVAHLGSGASIAAILGGKSMDTSMGFTPLEGLMMGTRSGDLDPGAPIFLQRHEPGASNPIALPDQKMSPDDLDTLLNKQSGLLGVSGSTDDMRELLEKSPRDPHAAQAVALFCYRAKKYVGAYAAALGGLDTLVFTGGIGERAPAVREQICSRSGLSRDSTRFIAQSEASEAIISTANSRVKVRVIPTNEELTIVRHALAILGDPRAASPPEVIMFVFDAKLSSTVEVSAPPPPRPAQSKGPLSPELLDKMHRYWQAANYLTVGQIYLRENPLLREPLEYRAHQAAPAGTLGHIAGAELHLRASQSPDQG